ELRDIDREILAQVEAGFERVGGLLAAVRLRDALSETMGLAREVNGYLDRAPGFKVIKEDPQAAATTIYTARRRLDNLKTLSAPGLPSTSQQVHEWLGYAGRPFGEQRSKTLHESERAHAALTYDPTGTLGHWEPSGLRPGQVLRE